MILKSKVGKVNYGILDKFFLHIALPRILHFIIFFCVTFFVFVEPFIYHYWIIPKIESRYKMKLVFNMPGYGLVLFPEWFLAPGEIAMYIVFKYLGLGMPLTKNPYAALKKINYDIKTASKAEIRMSFITVINFLLMITAPIVAGIGIDH